MSSSRYPSFDSRSSTSSHHSNLSSSSDLKNPNQNLSTLKRLVSNSNSSRILTRARSADIIAPPKIKNEQNFGSMVKKLMRSKPKTPIDRMTLVVPKDFIAEDLKKSAGRGSNLTNFPKKLFQKGTKDRMEIKALTEVKANTRSLAMVLRSERELLSQNKEYEAEITELREMLEGKNREVEKLKDLCLNQREEIKSLKSAILFPDVMNSQLKELYEKQGSELKQAKQVIPTLQKQVTSLTGQLQCLAEDLAEVKADKYAVKSCFGGHVSSPRTPEYDQEAANSLEFSSGDPVTPGSPDDMFLKDLNPCLTPYFDRTKSKEYEQMMGYDSPHESRFFGSNTQVFEEKRSSSHGVKMSKSSEYCQRPSFGSTVRVARKSDESKCTSGKPNRQRFL
ncbi:structural maintenance of chromosomes protein [Tasmannia lanceolata]|uniref:structural maintenance of chromosomes protein n=1 Tax=Tasmannia lanceolata TaxID=3420 RepID=UPI004062F8F2